MGDYPYGCPSQVEITPTRGPAPFPAPLLIFTRDLHEFVTFVALLHHTKAGCRASAVIQVTTFRTNVLDPPRLEAGSPEGRKPSPLFCRQNKML